VRFRLASYVGEVRLGSNSEVTALLRHFGFAPNIRHQLGVSALVLTNRAVVPNPASGSADASIIACLSYGAVDRRPLACTWRTMGSTLAASQSATCSAEPEVHATMLVRAGTLVAGLAVVAIAFEPPWPHWPLVPPRSGYSRIPF
jgi:hypothetical protein